MKLDYDSWLSKQFKDVEHKYKELYSATKDEVKIIKDAWEETEGHALIDDSNSSTSYFTPRTYSGRVFVNNASVLTTTQPSNLKTPNQTDSVVELYRNRIDVAKKISKIIDNQHHAYSDTDSFYNDYHEELLAQVLLNLDSFIDTVIAQHAKDELDTDVLRIHKKYILDLNTALLAAIVNPNLSCEDVNQIVKDVTSKVIKDLNQDQNNV